MTPVFFDAHCHIGNNETYPPCTSSIVGRLLCGISPNDWFLTKDAADSDPATIPAFGLHPWEITKAPDDWLETLGTLLASTPGAWLGEVGLDKARRGLPPLEEQKSVLAKQLNCARKLKRPACLHCVKAHEEILPLLDREYLSGKPRPFIMHAFTGSENYVKALAKRGAYFSVGSDAMRRDNMRVVESLSAIPDDRLLIESDDAISRSNTGQDGMSVDMSELAEIRCVKRELLAESILNNSRRLFLEL